MNQILHNHSIDSGHEEDSTIFFIVPAFNEAGIIESIVQSIAKEGFKPVVIDDCSSDQTAQIAYDNGATVLRHPINLGQGAAIQTGIDFCLSKKFSVLVTFDADGQHQVKDAKKMIASILNGEADIVCGSRFLGIHAVGMPPIRAFMLKMAALYTRFSIGLPVTDAHNGLRALSRLAALNIHITQNRMAHASEIMAQVKTLRFKEIPVEILYSDYSLAKGQRMSNALNIFLDLLIGKFLK